MSTREYQHTDKMSLSKMSIEQYKSLADLLRDLQEAAYAAADQQTRDCNLHGPQLQGGICHTANSRGYSMYAPACNGCKKGQQERKEGLWFSMLDTPEKTDSSGNTEKNNEK